MNRVLVGIGGLLVGLLGLLFAAPSMVDWNRYRGIFEEEATRALGREVRVGGRVNLRLLPIPYVRFEQVRVADTSANVGRPLFMADDFTVWLSVGALLSGAIEASEIELKKPVVTLVLDGKGGGSWSSLAMTGLPAHLVPSRVAFNAVRITGGALAILGPDGAPKSTFENINGELSAQALDGPYKVTAAFALAGAARELRLSTAKAAEDGSVRFKGTVRDPASGVAYSLDGLARDVLKSVVVTGELAARLPLPAALATGTDAKGGGPARARNGDGDFDLRAELKGDTSGFTLANLSLQFEQAGRPQFATGSARVNWSGRTDVKVALHSHWLDLDRIAGAETGASPVELMQGVASSVSRILATGGHTEATLAIDQATLGGDVVSAFAATLDQAGGKLAVRSLSAVLPGGTRVTAAGEFAGQAADYRYSGRISLRGASLARFSGWAARGHNLPLPARDGAFSIHGDVVLGTREVAGRNLSVEIGRNVLSGEAGWKAGQPQRLSLNLEGTEIDLTPVTAKGAEPAAALKGLIAGLAGSAKDAPATAFGQADADLRLRVDRLLVGATQFRDAVAEIKIAGGNLSLPQLRVTSADGYALELRGDIADLARPGAKGALTGLGVADSPAGLRALARIAGLPAEIVPEDEAARELVPLRLAGRWQVGLRGPDSHDLAADGTAADTRVSGTVRLGALPAGGWRERPADLAITLEGAGSVRLAYLAMGSRASTERTAGPAAAYRIDLRGIGTAKGGLHALAALESEGIKSEYRGKVSVDEAGQLGLSGEVDVALDELGRGLVLAGLPARPALAGAVSGSVRLERTAGRLRIASSGLRLAASLASGQLTFERSGDGQRVGGEVKLDRASLPGLLAALTTGSGQARPAGDQRSPWSEAPFDLTVIDRIAGSAVRAEVARLALAPGVEVADARLELAAKTASLDVRLEDAKAASGRLAGSLVIDKAPSGARVSAELALTAARLEAIAPRAGQQPAAQGLFSASLKAVGTALTPRGAIVALSGSGEIQLGQARLNRWTPHAVGTAAEAVLAVRGEVPPDALRAQLELALASAGVGLGSPKIAVAVADGALRAQPLVVTQPLGRLTGRFALDIDQMTLDGDWRIEPRSAPQPRDQPPKPELPGIALHYSGPIAMLGSLAPRLDFDALAREVVVRKVEREVAELERIRRLDEERAKTDAARLEAERQEVDRRLAEQRRIEAMQQGPVPIAPPSTGPPPAPSQVGAPPATAPAGPLAPSAAPQPDAMPPAQTGSNAVPASAATPPAPDAVAPTPAAAPPDGSPATRPAQVPASAKAKLRRDPFGSLREGSP